MQDFHTICRIPRSCSTKFCDIMNQNPEFHASSTSPLAMMVNQTSSLLSNSPEVKSELIADKEVYNDYLDGMRDTVAAKYDRKYKDKVIFDKGAGWLQTSSLLAELYPDAKIIVTVRDLRDVISDIERIHRDTALFDTSLTMETKDVANKAAEMLTDSGLIGSCLTGIADLHHRKLDNVFYMVAEKWTHEPELYFRRLYEFLGYEYFDHNFEDIPDSAEDTDELYLNKFPHHSKVRKVYPIEKDGWKKNISEELAQEIMNVAPLYNNKFGYV